MGFPNIELKAGVSHSTVKEISVIDPKVFKPHQVKETDEWSWKRMKNEKWHVWLDCNTGHLRRKKLS